MSKKKKRIDGDVSNLMPATVMPNDTLDLISLLDTIKHFLLLDGTTKIWQYDWRCCIQNSCNAPSSIDILATSKCLVLVIHTTLQIVEYDTALEGIQNGCNTPSSIGNLKMHS
jgi:hypothetical protein